MCGICGAVELGAPPHVDLVARMTATLAHRGPDGDGSFSEPGVALGHRRLAIIDLSDAGLQPFASADGRLQLLHNGEIYNYRELRHELEGKGHVFHTGTDTEVLLAAYLEWGTDCVRRFNGMWAFALWDRKHRSLFCSRDRMGVKPFYYRVDGGRFVFASELKAFRELGPLEPNLPIVRDYVEQGYLDHTDETFFAGIHQLPAAHTLVVDERGLAFSRYWSLEPKEPPPGDPAEAVRELFVDAVRLRLRSDVPVGTALSGGIDSSSIAVVIDHLLRTEVENTRPVGDRQQTFTAFFEDAGFDERPYAEEVIGRTLVNPHWVSFSAEGLLETVGPVVEALDEPFGSASMVSQWHVMRAARQAGITVMLDGQGGDEVLAGYPAYWGARFADLLASGKLAELRRETAAYRRLHGASAASVAVALARPFLPERLKWRLRARVTGAAPLVHASLRSLPPTPQPEPSPFPDRLRSTMHLILTRRGLPELLHYEDRNSMAHSIEARVPFLDYRLVELLFSLDGSHLIKAGYTKAVLRRALSDLLPPLVRDRTDKLGFVTPGGRFFREALGEAAVKMFASPSFAGRGFVDPGAALDRLRRHQSGEIQAGFELWRAFNVELWAQRFLGR